MAGNKKPRRPYTPRWDQGNKLLMHEPWRLRAVFGTVEAIMDMIEQDDTITTDADGVPIFCDAFDGCWYPVEPSLRGMCDAFDIHSTRWSRPVLTDGLLNLITKLKNDEQLVEQDLRDARASINSMKREASHMSVEYAKAIVKDSQIKFALEDHIREKA
jgi:hypothetical protein